MSNHWVNRVLRRQTKISRNRQLRKRTKRRLLLQSLASRQLLAGDMMLAEMHHGNDMPSAVSQSDTIQSATQASSIVDATAMPTNASWHTHMAHPALMALISAGQATHTVAASGNWSDPTVWENGELPTEGARVVIPQGMTVTVDSVISTEFKTIGIHGTLRFANDTDTQLRVDTIVSAPHGRFEMGTADNPIPSGVTAKVIFADDGTIDTNWDPEQLSRGAVLQGPTEIHGAETTHRVSLASFPSAGATSIELSSVPVNWSAGDEIVITGTQGSTSDEVRTIASIDATNVSFDEPLQLDHVPPKTDLNVYVANKTRNVQFSSENPAVAHRGHIMLMHTLDVNIQNVEFSDLGRTNKSRPLDDLNFEFTEDAVGNETSAPVVFTTTTGARTNARGRYAVHVHRGGVTPGRSPATISGSVVDGSPGWGFVNHSSNVNMIDNITYGVQGAAFYTEVGDEIGSMVGNIAIRTVNPSFTLDHEGAIDPDLGLEQMNFGVDGDGYWLSGHMVSMRDNVSAGASGHGIIIWSDGVIEPDLARGRSSVLVANVENGDLITGRETIPTWWAPLAEISNNESYGATIGFRSRYVHSAGYLGEIGSAFHTPPDQAYIDTLTPTIDGLTVWGSRDGMLMNYNERMSIKNTRLIGIGAPYVQNGGTADTGVGIDMYNEVTRGPGVIENVSVEGFNMGVLAPRQDSWSVNNVQLRNTTDMLITEARQAPRDLQMSNVTFGSLAGTAVEDQGAQRRNVVMSADFDSDAHQPFFFLMSDRVTLNGQQLYFDAQSANAVPIANQIENEAVRLPAEMIGQTNQQLLDRYGTSFGGAITPDDATNVEFLSGGVAGSLAPAPVTSPPLYNMASEGAGGVLEDPGTLTNFSGGVPGPGDGEDEGEEDGEGDSEAPEDDEVDDDGDSEEDDESETDVEDEVDSDEMGDVEEEDTESDDEKIETDDEECQSDDEEEADLDDIDDEEDEETESDDEEDDNDDEDSEAGDEEEADPDEIDEEDGDTESDDEEVDNDDEEFDGDEDDEETDEETDDVDEDQPDSGSVQVTTGIRYGQAPLGGTPSPLTLDLYQPTTTSETPRPLIVMIHGGGYVSGNPDSMEDLAQQMAGRGYVVASIGYRLGASNGDVAEPFLTMAREALAGTNISEEEQPPASAVGAGMQDAASALNWLGQNASTYGIDSSRIAVWGESAGAISALQSAYALDDYGVSVPNINAVVSHMGGLGVDSLMEAGEAPLFIVHGTDDQIVPYIEAQELQAQASSVGVPVEVIAVEGGGHDVTMDQQVDGATLFESVASFIDSALSHTPEDPGSIGSGDESGEGDQADDGEEFDTDEDESERDEEDSFETDSQRRPRHNRSRPTDVNDDGNVTALDALKVINRLNRSVPGLLDELAQAASDYFDVNADQRTTAVDALIVINYLNAIGSTLNAGETEITQRELLVDAALSEDESDDFADDLLLTLAEDQTRERF